MNYYEHHLGDWAAATGHLTWDEDMAYTRLLRAYYHSEKAIPEGQQYRLAKAVTAVQRKAVDAVLSEFFALADGAHHQKRADVEIERYLDKQRKAKASANARWSQSERNANASIDESAKMDANALRTQSEGNALQSPDTRHQTPTTPKAPKGAGTVHKFPPGFDRFWDAYPKKVGKDAAAKAFAQRKPDVALLEAMLLAISLQRVTDAWTKDGGQFIPNPATWLNQGRWQDDISPSLDVPEFLRERGL